MGRIVFHEWGIAELMIANVVESSRAFGVAGSVYLAILLIKTCLAMAYHLRQQSSPRNNSFSAEHASEFCVVQPILSGDPQLESTLQTNLRSLHNRVAFFWMVDADDHVAIEICERLQAQETSPEARITIIRCQPSPLNQNPKTWKLQTALEMCNDRYIVVLDDDTTIEDTSLAAAWISLQTNALHTGLPLYRRGESLWSDLVAHFVANNSILTYLPPLVMFEPLTINGMFYVTRCETLRSLGGFSAIVNELCDDYAIKKLYSRAGQRIHQGVSYQVISTSVDTFREYQRLMHRWNVFAIQLFKDQSFAAQAVLATFLGMPPILLLISLSTSLFSMESLCFMGALLIGRDILLRTVQRVVFGRRSSMNSFYSLIAECLQPLHLISAGIQPSIRWRHRTIRVGRDMH